MNIVLSLAAAQPIGIPASPDWACLGLFVAGALLLIQALRTCRPA